MEKKKKLIYCIVLFVLTAVLSFGAYYLGRTVNINSRAERLLKNTLAKLETEYDIANSEAKMLTKIKDDLNSQIKAKAEINKEIEQSVKEINAVTAETEEIKSKIDELDKQIADKNTELAEADKILSSADGKRFSAGTGVYECPKNIAPGRYTVSGDYTLIIYSADGAPKVSESLSRLETKSFVFTIADGEKIKLAK